MINNNWKKFAEATKNRKPVGFLVEAVEKIGVPPGCALDLGCGAGVDAKYLAEKGFNVEAVDLSADCIKQTKITCDGLGVEIIKKDVSKFAIEKEKYSVILSWNLLSFLKKRDTNKVFKNIRNGLTSGGAFVFSIFGPEDAFAKTKADMSFWNVADFKKAMSGLKFIKILEVKEEKTGVTGITKFWHLIQGIMIK